MIAPFDWINEFIDLPINQDLIGNAFSELGFEVENINNEKVEIEVTPNRADMLSITGIARELNIKFSNRTKILEKTKSILQKSSKLIDIKINEKHEVINFGGLVIKDAIITSSPEYIKNRLLISGLKPINNFVDLTNYLMLETGQPLHSFDLDSIGSQLTLRYSRAGETLKLLDGNQINLEDGYLVYQSNKQLVDLIGVMGGMSSSTTKSTKNIFVQAAIFNPSLIRLASKSFKISTPASYRYERGVDENQTQNTILKFKEIVEKNEWGKVEEIFYKEYNIPKLRNISIEFPLVDRLIGTKFQKDFCIKALKSIGCIVKNNIISPPSYRKDIFIWQDLAEEIARIYGYNNLIVKQIDKPKLKVDNSYYWKKYALKQQLANLGFNEISTYSFLSDKETKIFETSQEKLIKIKNPLSNEHRSLRNSLIPLLIKTASKNPWHSNIMLFEIGNIFNTNNEIEHVALLSYKELKIDKELKIEPQDKIFSNFKIRKPIYVYESNLDKAYEIFNIKNNIGFDEPTLKPIKFRSFSNQYPTVMDISIIVNKNIEFDTISQSLKKIGNVFEIDLFDKFENINLGENNISYAFHLVFDIQDIDKINNIYQKVLVSLNNNFNAIIR